MADGREVVAEMIVAIEANSATLVEKLPSSKEIMDEIQLGFSIIQKKFYLKTQGGSEKALESQVALADVISELNNGGQELQAKFEAFTKLAKGLIHTTSTTVIRMT